MKKAIIGMLAGICATACVHAQGTIDFANVGFAPWTSPGGANLDSSYSVQLLAGPQGTAEGSLSAIGAVATFLGTTGWFSDGTRIINSVLPGAVATVQVVAWKGAASYAEALTTVGAEFGASNLLDITTGGASIGGNPPTSPAALTGLNGVQLMTVVPEPSVIALAIAGAGMLFLRRRK